MEKSFIQSVSELDLSNLRMDDIRILGSVGGVLREKSTSGVKETMRAAVATPVAHIENGIWDEIAEQVIAAEPADADGTKPSEALEALDRYFATEGNKYLREHTRERRHMALRTCAARSYADPNWEGYEVYRKRYAPGTNQP